MRAWTLFSCRSTTYAIRCKGLGGTSEGCGPPFFGRSGAEVGEVEVAWGFTHRPIGAPVVASDCGGVTKDTSVATALAP